MPLRRRVRRRLADQQAVSADPVEQRRVRLRVGPVEPAGQHRDRQPAGRERAAVRGRVDAERAAGHDRPAALGQPEPELGRDVVAVRGRRPRARPPPPPGRTPSSNRGRPAHPERQRRGPLDRVPSAGRPTLQVVRDLHRAAASSSGALTGSAGVTSRTPSSMRPGQIGRGPSPAAAAPRPGLRPGRPRCRPAAPAPRSTGPTLADEVEHGSPLRLAPPASTTPAPAASSPGRRSPPGHGVLQCRPQGDGLLDVGRARPGAARPGRASDQATRSTRS